MSTYLIGYDLRKKPEKDYEDLIDAIKRVGEKWWHHLDSTWVVVSGKTAAQIRDELTPHIHSNDELLVAKSASEGAWSGFNTNGSTWLSSNL